MVCGLIFKALLLLFQVQQAIYSNLKDRTVLIIAHRLSTVENASRIVVLDRGHVVEQGSHVELMSNNATYARLVKRQMLGFTNSASGRESPAVASQQRKEETPADVTCHPRASASLDIAAVRPSLARLASVTSASSVKSRDSN